MSAFKERPRSSPPPIYLLLPHLPGGAYCTGPAALWPLLTQPPHLPTCCLWFQHSHPCRMFLCLSSSCPAFLAWRTIPTGPGLLLASPQILSASAEEHLLLGALGSAHRVGPFPGSHRTIAPWVHTCLPAGSASGWRTVGAPSLCAECTALHASHPLLSRLPAKWRQRTLAEHSLRSKHALCLVGGR